MGFSRQEYCWVAIPFSRGSSQPRDRARVSCIAGRFFTVWVTGKSCHLTDSGKGHGREQPADHERSGTMVLQGPRALPPVCQFTSPPTSFQDARTTSIATCAPVYLAPHILPRCKDHEHRHLRASLPRPPHPSKMQGPRASPPARQFTSPPTSFQDNVMGLDGWMWT